MSPIILYCTLFAVICAVDLSVADFHSEILKHGPDCFKEHDVDESDLEKLGKEDIQPEDISQNLKCAMHCVMMKADVMFADGKVNADMVRTLLDDEDKEKFEEAFEECNKISDEDACETAFLTFGCMMDKKNGKK